MTSVNNTAYDDFPYLTAYDGIFPIATVTGPENLAPGDVVTLTVSDPAWKITRIVAAWDQIGYCDNGELDRLRFEDTTVPEPSSIVVWSLIGLTCGIVCYRRKRRAVA